MKKHTQGQSIQLKGKFLWNVYVLGIGINISFVLYSMAA